MVEEITISLANAFPFFPATVGIIDLIIRVVTDVVTNPFVDGAYFFIVVFAAVSYGISNVRKIVF